MNISSHGHPARVYPARQPDPWRRARSKDPAWVEFYGVAEATANGYFTAASGQTIYQADAFPPEFHDNHFCTDNAQNLIHRCLLLLDQASYVVKRQSRLHALCTLDGLGALPPSVLAQGLDDPHFAVRMYALRLAEPWLDTRKELAEKVVSMIDDCHPRVRLQTAMALGQRHDGRGVEILAQLAARHGDQQWMATAILSSVAGSADRLLETIIRQGAAAGKGRTLVRPLASIVGARHKDEEVGSLLAVLGDDHGSATGALRIACLEGLIEGLDRGRPQALTSAAGIRGLRRLLTCRSADVRRWKPRRSR